MTPFAGIVIGAIAMCAVANWISRSKPSGRLETVTKPLTTILIIVLAVVLRTSHSQTKVLVVMGLALCLVGDVLLMPIIDNFVGGLGSFLVGHVMFAAAVLRRPHGHVALAGLALVPIVAVVARFGPAIVKGARARASSLGLAVTGYLLVIALMAIMVPLTGSPLAIVGAALFVASDTLLGFDLFAHPVAAARRTAFDVRPFRPRPRHAAPRSDGVGDPARARDLQRRRGGTRCRRLLGDP